jgi:hypothetical protein
VELTSRRAESLIEYLQSIFEAQSTSVYQVIKDRLLPMFPCLAFDHPAIASLHQFAAFGMLIRQNLMYSQHQRAFAATSGTLSLEGSAHHELDLPCFGGSFQD